MSISQPPPLLQATAVTPPGRKPIFAIPILYAVTQPKKREVAKEVFGFYLQE